MSFLKQPGITREYVFLSDLLKEKPILINPELFNNLKNIIYNI